MKAEKQAARAAAKAAKEAEKQAKRDQRLAGRQQGGGFKWDEVLVELSPRLAEHAIGWGAMQRLRDNSGGALAYRTAPPPALPEAMLVRWRRKAAAAVLAGSLPPSQASQGDAFGTQANDEHVITGEKCTQICMSAFACAAAGAASG